jgi:histone H3/H4
MEVLVVASKIKKYIKDKSDMNTSTSVMQALTEAVMRECDNAIENAKADRRKTVMDRDISS